jgi:hypothetical protein
MESMSDGTELVRAREAVLDAVRRTLAAGGLSLRPAELPTPVPGTSWRWRSGRDWLGPLAQTEERALVFVAMDVVARITASDAWRSGDHNGRLDPGFELDQIDGRAHELAALRHQAGDRVGREHAAVLADSWTALVDRVAALSGYADRLPMMAHEPTELADEQVARLLAGRAGDELAADQVHALAGELPAITNSETSHRNGT